MQIRDKGKSILLIRTEYSKEKKRTFGKTVASFPRFHNQIPAEVREKLTPEEIEELESWLKKRTEKQSVDSMRTSLYLAPHTLAAMVQALENEEGRANLTPQDAVKIWGHIEALTKALTKAGFKRPKAAPAPAKFKAKKGEPELPLV